MRSKIVRLGVIVGVLAIATGTAVTTATAGSPHDTSDSARYIYVNGLRLPDTGEADGDSTEQGLTVDSNGGEHVLAPNADGSQWVYYTLLPGDDTFTAEPTGWPIPPVEPETGNDVAMVRTPSGTAIDIAVATCTGIDVMTIPATARAVPASPDATMAVPSECKSSQIPGLTPGAIVSLADGRVAMTVGEGDPYQDPQPKQPIYIGKPGQAFAKTTLTANVIGADLSGQHVYAANGGDASSGTPVPLQVYTLSDLKPSTSWTRIGNITLSHSKTWQTWNGAGSIAASHGQIWVAMYGSHQWVGSPWDAVPVVIRGSVNGHWKPFRELPNDEQTVHRMILAANPASTSPEMWNVEDFVCYAVTQREYTTASGNWSSPAVPDGATWSSSLLGASVGWDGKAYVEYIEDPTDPATNPDVTDCLDPGYGR